MAKANGSSVKFTIGEQSAIGVAPTSMIELKSLVVGESLNASFTQLQSQAITEARDVEDTRNGIGTMSGSAGCEIATQGTEIFYKNCLGKVVSTETAPSSGIFKKVYTREPDVGYLTIERQYTSLPVLDIQKYTDVKVDKMDFNFDPTALVTATVEFMGVKSDKSSTPIDASPDTFVHKPFAGIDAIVTKIAGVQTEMIKATLSIANNAEPSNVLGEQFAVDVVVGKGSVSGTMDLYFEDRTHYDMFRSETEFALEIGLVRGAETTTFKVPRAKFTGNSDVPISTDKALIASYSFMGLNDASINGAIAIEVVNENA